MIWKMNFDNWLIRHSGAFLMIAGIEGHIINFNFDKILGRSEAHSAWGWMNTWAFIGSTALMYTGWVCFCAYRSWNADVEDE